MATYVETGGNDNGYLLYTGTSAAAPMAAAAAGLVRNWLSGLGGGVTPAAGNVNATLIHYGTFGGAFPDFNGTYGAGRVVFPGAQGNMWWGTVNLVSGQCATIPIQVNCCGGTPRNFRVGVWYPEPNTQAYHNGVDLRVDYPNGSQFAVSAQGNTNFQKVFVAGTLTSPSYNVRVCGSSYYLGTQRAYYAVSNER